MENILKTCCKIMLLMRDLQLSKIKKTTNAHDLETKSDEHILTRLSHVHHYLMSPGNSCSCRLCYLQHFCIWMHCASRQTGEDIFLFCFCFVTCVCRMCFLKLRCLELSGHRKKCSKSIDLIDSSLRFSEDFRRQCNQKCDSNPNVHS